MPPDVSDTELDILWNWHVGGLRLPPSCSARETDQGPEICFRQRLSIAHPMRDDCWLRHAMPMEGRYWRQVQ